MSLRMPIIGLLCLIIYIALSINQHGQKKIKTSNISPPLPSQALKIIGHSYLKQFIAETLFIKTAVYSGGLKKEPDPENLVIIGQYFLAMSQLHPKMIDIYYRAESTLAHRGSPYVQTANKILEAGRYSLPNKVILPFLEGFNYFNYLNNPLKAGKILATASKIAGAPQWIGHLASTLMAGEGNIRSGLALLQGMYASSQNKQEKERYEKDIIAFKKALSVQQALNNYRQQQGKPVATLNELVPAYLKSLPLFKENYFLEYNPPNVSLLRRGK